MSNAAPGFVSHPNHSVEITTATSAVRITIGDEIIATTMSAMLLKENQYADAYYIPISTLPDIMLELSDHSTHCPFKGDASYYHLIHDGKMHENAVWSYNAPYDEALAIKGFIAIYPNVAKVAPITELMIEA